MKSTYMMINDRSCCGKELEIDFFTQEPSAHNKISTFCQNKSTTRFLKFVHDVFLTFRKI